MDIYDKYIVDCAESMRVFAGDDESFKLGEWKAWRTACEREGKLLDPELFKSKKRV